MRAWYPITICTFWLNSEWLFMLILIDAMHLIQWWMDFVHLSQWIWILYVQIYWVFTRRSDMFNGLRNSYEEKQKKKRTENPIMSINTSNINIGTHIRTQMHRARVQGRLQKLSMFNMRINPLFHPFIYHIYTHTHTHWNVCKNLKSMYIPGFGLVITLCKHDGQISECSVDTMTLRKWAYQR